MKQKLPKLFMSALLGGALLFSGTLPARAATDAEATMIRELDGIYKLLAGTVTTAAQSVQRTPTDTLVSTSGTVAAGARSVEFVFSSDFTGTLLGVAYSGATDTSKRYVADANNTLAAIAYTRSAGSMRITEIR